MGVMCLCSVAVGGAFGVTLGNRVRALEHAVSMAADMEAGLTLAFFLDAELARGGVRKGCETPAGGFTGDSEVLSGD